MIRTPHFTLTDAQLDSLVDALVYALDDIGEYIDYLHKEAVKEDANDADLDDAIMFAEEDRSRWTFLRDELQDMIDARPKLTIVKPFNPEHN
jgi:hypothetical protein